MMLRKLVLPFLMLSFFHASSQTYPRNYFRSPLNIPMQLVANFGEIRANHWHMGLDIRTQHKVNLPVYAAADGYVSRVSVEPGGFGQAIYITHPNGYTTLYGHLNSFFPALASYVKEQQYSLQSWQVNLILPPGLFVVKKGEFIALSGSTGASEGPHVHFEIRDTKTENCLNPLLFGFPIADKVPPPVFRLAMYDRNKSTYKQNPQFLSLKRSGSSYSLAGGSIKVGSDKISFAIGAVDNFSGTTNPNGIYSASVTLDGDPVSEFVLDNISYNETRYINAQLDYPYKTKHGSSLQHITPLPGARDVVYHLTSQDGAISLKDTSPHLVNIKVGDANGNTSEIKFSVSYDPALAKPYETNNTEQFIPGNVNIFERQDFELYTSESTIYDTIPVFFETSGSEGSSRIYSFLDRSVPAHDFFTVRIKPEGISESDSSKMIIKNVSGSKTFVEKASWQKGWVSAHFRQFGTFQAFADHEPPVLNAPATNLTRASRIVFTPKDNFNTINSFRAELDGNWLRFSNDKGRSWIYNFDEKFPRGKHELTVSVMDAAGNVTTKTWTVTR